MIWNLEKHREAFPHSAVYEREGRLYGCWMIGNNYKRVSGYYGEFPPRFLDRVYSLFPNYRRCLHVFSGSLSTLGDLRNVTLDNSENCPADIQANAENLSKEGLGRFDLIIADPPYGTADCKVYSCKMPNKAKVMREIRKVISDDGVLCWLDLRRPMYRKEEWLFSGMISLDCGTNRRVRALSIFKPRHQQY